MSATTAPRPSLGLRLCQIAVPALAIPSALGVSKFFSVADGHPETWTAQGIIAAGGFELTNIGLSILDIRRPELHQTVQQVRFWSVATAIAMNVIAHYATAAGDADGFALIPAVLALVASVPLAVLYVKLAALLHAISAGEHAEQDLLAGLREELAKVRDELAGKARDLARVQAELAGARETHAQELARVRDEAREAREQHEAVLAGVREEARITREADATLTALAREELARVQAELAGTREGHATELREAREAARVAERERAKLARELEQLRAEATRPRVLSREDLVREARELAAARGWGASEIGRHLGWPESTVRGWLPSSRPVSAAD